MRKGVVQIGLTMINRNMIRRRDREAHWEHARRSLQEYRNTRSKNVGGYSGVLSAIDLPKPAVEPLILGFYGCKAIDSRAMGLAVPWYHREPLIHLAVGRLNELQLSGSGRVIWEHPSYSVPQDVVNPAWGGLPRPVIALPKDFECQSSTANVLPAYALVDLGHHVLSLRGCEAPVEWHAKRLFIEPLIHLAVVRLNALQSSGGGQVIREHPSYFTP
ncbi:hypothetical protein BHE74_00003586 [Ensete ventricosum]|nr:hypothetical protein BHE74_00003586 [Ensete ventricosum]